MVLSGQTPGYRHVSYSLREERVQIVVNFHTRSFLLRSYFNRPKLTFMIRRIIRHQNLPFRHSSRLREASETRIEENDADIARGCRAEHD